jgi:hypothetical protein
MNGKDNVLRKLYQPTQPAVKGGDKEVFYGEFLPDPRLHSTIYCYWQLATNKPLNEAFNYRVVADGCIDVFFNLNAPQESFVMGFCRHYTEFALEQTFNYVGIRFLPAMFPHCFGVDAKSLTNAYFELDSILPHLAQFISDRITVEMERSSISNILDDYFLNQLSSPSNGIDSRFYNALNIILKHGGVLATEKELDTGISPRQLRRVFDHYIGTSPKTFCKVIQFQHILRAKPSVQTLRQSKIFYDAGYFDQAHFIKDFKHFYGVTPTEAFR